MGGTSFAEDWGEAKLEARKDKLHRSAEVPDCLSERSFDRDVGQICKLSTTAAAYSVSASQPAALLHCA